MTSIIRLCPLSGGLSDSVDDAIAAHCYLLEVDQYTFLLDCGWDSKFSPEIIQELKRHVHKVRISIQTRVYSRWDFCVKKGIFLIITMPIVY